MPEPARFRFDGQWRDSQGIPLDIAATYTPSFLERINARNARAAVVSDYANEIFLYFGLPLAEGQSLIAGPNPTRVEILPGSRHWEMATHAALTTGCRPTPATLGRYWLLQAFWFLVAPLATLTGAFLLGSALLFWGRPRAASTGQSFGVLRTPAARSKMAWLGTEGVTFLFDDLHGLKNAGPSLYASTPLWRRVLGIPGIAALALRDLSQIVRDSRTLLGMALPGSLLRYYMQRIPHKCAFEWHLAGLLAGRGGGTYYTGNKEDRFALLEQRLCRRFGLGTVCIPHGLEYSYQMPGGLVGDRFFATTEEARACLQRFARPSQTFVFDATVAEHMLALKDRRPSGPARIVFFTEAREVEVNIQIIRTITGAGLPLCLKLHPRDRVANYSEFGDRLTVLTDLGEALCGNICLARKSTVLVEAIYNRATPVAVLFDPRDRAYVELMFPSLSSASILRVNQPESLLTLLRERTSVSQSS